ncbi:MAG: 5'-nucleotidase C-terminal domain-containing protein [Bacteroidota bacterium]|nr:5'-nucleotidase C-terminal domain-containing protein [Bacteroidota bacterium]
MSDLRFIIYLGVFILLSIKKEIPVLESYEEDLIQVQIHPDSSILSIIQPYKEGIDSVMNEVLCYSNIIISKNKPESLLGNFVTDLCLETFSEQADICVMNNGGLRAELPKGEITIGKIYELMPFDNELVVVVLNKTEQKDLFEYIVSRGGEPFSGMKINIDTSGNISTSMNTHNKTYTNMRVLTSDYLANGGDKMRFFENKEQIKVGLKVRDVIINYCTSKDTITSSLDNRIKYE